MEPKRVEAIENELLTLEQDVLGYLEFQSEVSKADPTLKKLLLESPVEMPDPYFLYKKLRLLGMQLYPGGYLNQPYLTTRQLEACAKAELKYSSQILAEQVKNAQ